MNTIIEQAINECPMIQKLKPLTFNFEKFDQIQETLNDFHEKNLELHNFLSYNFEDLSSTLLENLHYYNTSIQSLLKMPDSFNLQNILEDKMQALPIYFQEIFSYEFQIFQQQLYQTLKPLQSDRSRPHVFESINKLLAKEYTPQTLPHQLYLISLELKHLEQIDQFFQNTIISIIKKIIEFTQKLFQNVKEFQNSAQKIRENYFIESNSSLQKIILEGDQEEIVSERYETLKKKDLRGLVQNTEISLEILRFFSNYLYDRSQQGLNQVLVLKIDFFAKLTKGGFGEALAYDDVRNATKWWYGIQTIFDHFKEIIISVPYHPNYQCIVKIKNFPLKQIYIFDHFESNSELRLKIFKIIKGYMYLEYLDKSGKTSNESLDFVNEYIELSQIIPHFEFPNRNIHYLWCLKMLADGLPLTNELKLSLDSLKELKSLIYELIKNIGSHKGSISLEHLF